MLKFKPFFIHYHYQDAKKGKHERPRGFTAIVKPVENSTEPRVAVQLAFCSQSDLFCRKTGRKEAGEKEAKEIPAKELGRFLYRNQKKCQHLYGIDYTYVYRYLV